MLRQKQRWFPWMLAVLLVLSLAWLPGIGEAAATKLVIFHTNDMHARVQKGDDSGNSIGLAEMAAAVKAVKAQNPDTLWLDAGDTLHGMPRINISRGENIIPLLNEAGIDAMSPGNHDFNYGSDRLEELAKQLHFPVLSANTVKKGTKKHPFQQYKIFRFGDLTVGVFGLTTPETAFKTNPMNVKNIEFLNPVDVSLEMVKKLRKKCDVVIAVMHMGVDQSSQFTSERIAREVPGIDLIVDGHSHTALPDGLEVGDTLIVQTGWHEYRLGRVDFQITDRRITAKRAQLLDAEEVKQLAPKPDAAIEKTLTEIEQRNEKLFGEVIAHSDKTLTSNRLVLRRHESELGNLCADAFRWRTGADIAIINGGGMRSDLPAGDVTRGDIMAIFPFGNTIQMAEISGKAIREMLEHSVYGYPASFGGFLDVSGASFSFDPTKPVGSRVGDVYIGGKPLDEAHTYTLTANDFLFAGGDDYGMLKGLHVIGEFDTCEEILADYLNSVGVGDIKTGRITLLKEVPIPDEVPDGETSYIHAEEKEAA